MELRLLLAYPSAVPEKAVAGFNLAAAFYLLEAKPCFVFKRIFSMQLKRTHDNGIECKIYQDSSKRCTIIIRYRQPPSSSLASHETTLDGAKRIADNTVEKSGHVCNGSCKGWEMV